MNITVVEDYSDTKSPQIRETAEDYQHAVEQSNTEEYEEVDDDAVDEDAEVAYNRGKCMHAVLWLPKTMKKLLSVIVKL